MTAKTGYADRTLVRRLLGEARPYALHIVGLLALGLLAAPLALLGPLPLKIAVDSVLGAHPLPHALRFLGTRPTAEVALLIAVALLVGTALLKQLQDLATQLLRAYVLEKMTLDMRSRLFLHSQRLSLTHHDRQGTADSIYRIQTDVRDAQSILIEGLFPSITAGLTLVGMLVITARLDWQLAIVALAISPVLFAMNQYYRRRFRVRWREVRSLETSALSVVQEVLGTLRVVKAFGQETREQDRFLERSGQGMWARLRLTAAEGGYGMQVSVLSALGTAAVLFAGIRHVQSGVLTLGELLIVMGYLTQLYEPLKTLSKKATGLQNKLAAAERVFTLLDSEPDVVERPQARPLARARGRVEFQHVFAGYSDDRMVLTDISFVVVPGTRVGIAGPTGAGKTTLMSLLLRFYDPRQGRILLDGVDLRDYRLQDLRQQYAMVLQEPVLFSTTLAENIGYARPDAGRDAIVEAAKAAHAHEFIEGLPQGYDTQVGERGMSLSGGERQRVSLARAFLKDAPILILDEPTSAVDIRTESLIMTAMERLMQGRTAFLVAHRLSTLEICDLRLELDQGKLVAYREAARASGTEH